jgi:hypothetical protein
MRFVRPKTFGLLYRRVETGAGAAEATGAA